MFKLLLLTVLTISMALCHVEGRQVFNYLGRDHQVPNNLYKEPTVESFKYPAEVQDIFSPSEDNQQVFNQLDEHHQVLNHPENQVFNLPEEDILLPVESLPPRTLLRLRRQAFGGFTAFPSGGFNQQAGYRGSVFSTPTKDLSAWGSLSQSGISQGPLRPPSVGPITYSGGADFRTASGSGLSGSYSHTDKLGGAATISGNLNVLKTPSHNLNAFATHTQPYDTHFNRQGPGTTTLGTTYSHARGTELSLSGTRTPGQPNSASVGASVPLYNSRDGNTKVMLGGQSNFREGAKPSHQVGLSVTSQF